MPAWGNALPPQTIWLLVAYIQSLGGSTAATSADAMVPPATDPGQGVSTGQKQ
jgi:mono/diheme cytochrome c family protein